MGNPEQIIMTVPTERLFRDKPFVGFSPASAYDYESQILLHYRWRRRGTENEDPKISAEADPTHRQPILYALIVNPKSKRVFAYQRSSDKTEYQEPRLQGNWSWGVGGHVERIDAREQNPLTASLDRELAQEVKISEEITGIHKLGFINDTNAVGQVHFGVLYLVETDATSVLPGKDKEMATGRLHTIEELENILETARRAPTECVVEGWSKIAFEPLTRYLFSSP